VILTAVSCSVYDESLLGSGPAAGGGAGMGSAGQAGAAGSGAGAGHSGSAGSAVGGASGGSAGEAGMMDTAGVMEAGGDSSEGGSAGSSGSAGNGGTAGSSAGTGGDSTAGAGTGGTSGAGTGGSSGSGGSAGSGGAAVTGCAVLTVPIDAGTDQAHFVISLPSATDMKAGVISMHLYVQDGKAGTVFNYVQDSGNRWLGVATANRPSLNVPGWRTLTFDVGMADAGSTGIAKTDIRRIGIEINARPATSGWSNPTVVYVDSITVATPTLSYTFDTSATVSVNPSSGDVGGQVLWQHSGSTDTTASGVTLGWVATCP